MARLSSLLTAAAIASRAIAAGTFKTSLVITYEKGSPDGFERDMFKVNGTSPGPEIVFDEGDDVEINVINYSNQNVTIHWHGLDQLGTPESDGVPGVTQLPIQPNENYLYRFKATQHGSYWYHSHLKSQLNDGCMGPLRIRPRPDTEMPFHLIDPSCDAIKEMTESAANPKTLMITDWWHRNSDDLQAISLATGFEIGCFDSFLFNGKAKGVCRSAEELAQNANPIMQAGLGLVNMTLTDKGCLPPQAINALFASIAPPGNVSLLDPDLYNGCHATDTPMEIIEVGLGDYSAIELVSTMGFASPIFSIDEQSLHIWAVDGQPIEPQTVQAISIGSGERYSFFVNPEYPGDYTIRVAQVGPFQVIEGTAILRVRPSTVGGGPSCDNGSGSGSSTAPAPVSTPFFSIGGAPLSDDIALYNFTLGVPYPPLPVSQDVYAFHRLEMTLVNNSAITWSLNGTTENMTALEGRDPPLLYSPPAATLEPGNSFSTLNNTWHDVLLITELAVQHVFHKHSSKFHVLGAGVGNFTWDTVAEAAAAMPGVFNLENPPARDTIFTIGAVDVQHPGWMVIRFPSMNPGPFVMHCHIKTHMANGMLLVVEEGIDEWPKFN